VASKILKIHTYESNLSLFLASFRVKSYSRIINECTDISGECNKEYKNACSVITECLDNSLFVIMCLNKTFSENDVWELLNSKRCRNVCNLKLIVRKTCVEYII